MGVDCGTARGGVVKMKRDTRSIESRLLEIGEKQYQFGRTGILRVLPITVGLSILFLIVHFITRGGFETFIDAFKFDFGMLDGLQAIVVIAIYLGVLYTLVGVPFYFCGLHYLGLGKISENTKKDRSEKAL